MDLELRDSICLITGPAKGLGAAVTWAFAREGCHLALLGRDRDAMAAMAEELRAAGTRAQVFECDVTDAKACEHAARDAYEAMGQSVDVLVNVAGGSGPVGKSAMETTSEEFESIVDINLVGCFNTMRAVLPYMRAQGGGRIVNVGGTFGMRGRAGRSSYSASKWGLRGLTKSIALEVGCDNINVNTVAPGMVDGPRFREKVCPDMAKRLGISEAEAAERHCAEYALGRVSQSQDVADACLFLASPRARQITGVDMPVDGGWAAL